jgi:hypothetical protein
MIGAAVPDPKRRFATINCRNAKGFLVVVQFEIPPDSATR